MELIRPFDRIGKSDVASAGGKGASLGEMTQAGIPVPPGFVILAGAFDRFLDEAGLNQELDSIFHSVRHEEIRTVESASERIQELITAAPMPEDIAALIREEFEKLDTRFVAVRSSATAEDGSTAAWAGQLETYLNTTEENVITNVQKCWASLFTPRAIFYRFEKGMHGSKISVAVVVQKMVQSEVSGIAFSVHPVTEDYNQLIIEAGFGLGEAVVSGQVTPDSFVVEKEPRRIIDKSITYQSRALWRAESAGNEWRALSQEEGTKPALLDEQVMELAEMVLRIESHYGFPCDIEWAFEAGHFYITQSRPITTLSPRVREIDEVSAAEKWCHWGRWPTNLLYHSLWSRYPTSQIVQENPFLSAHAYQILDGHYFFLKEDMERIYRDTQALIQNDPSWFVRFFQRCESSVHRLGSMPSDITLTAYFEAARETLALSFAVELLDRALERYVEEQSRLQNIDSNDVFETMTVRRKTPLMAFQELTAAEAKEASKEYEWVGTHGFEGASVLKSGSTHEPRTSAAHVIPKPVAGFERLAEIGSELTFFRSYLVEMVDKFLYQKWEEIESVGAAHGLDWKATTALSAEELLSLQASNVLPADLAIRQDLFGLIVSESSYRIMSGAHVTQALAALHYSETNHSSVVEVRGRPAYKGIVRGHVRILFNSSDADKVEVGDILVATETQPDFIVALGRAAAFVTDHGGITSHAALIAREMRKPCVIGTRNATTVFKDGDLVEVDAEQGIVRKI